ncbi:choice-of-anchor J domain-containing protein [Bacteroidota bacterium]
MKHLFTIFLATILAISLNAQTVYMSENFQGGIKSTWRNIDNDQNTLHSQNGLASVLKAGEGWAVQQSGGVYWALSTSYFASAGQADDWLITNQINLGANAILSWDSFSGWASSGFMESYQVMISTTGNNIEDFVELVQINSEISASRLLELSEYADQSIYLAFRNNSPNIEKGYLFIGNIQVFTPEENDILISEIDLPAFTEMEEDGTVIKGELLSAGYQELNSFELNYQVDDGEVLTATIEDLALNYNDPFTFEHPVKWISPSAESHSVKVWVSKVNGVDITPGTNNEKTHNVITASNSYDKLPLYEEFTSSTCGPCATVNTYYFNPYLSSHKGNYTIIKYQMNWPGSGDIYYNADGGIRRTYYGVSGVPDLYVNGNRTSGADTMLITERSSELGIIDINATYNIYEEGLNNKIDVNVELTPYFNSAPTDRLILHVGVIENKTTGNVGSNGETEFHYVEQKMLPNGNGTQLSDLMNNEMQDFDFSYTFSNSNVEEFDDLSVVLFIQERTSKAVFATTWATVATSVEENQSNDGNGIVALFPNPAVENVYFRYNVTGSLNVDIELFNIEGQKINSINKNTLSRGTYTEEINTSNFQNGAYILKLVVGGKTYSKLFVVNR